jgi:HEAT repeat protein
LAALGSEGAIKALLRRLSDPDASVRAWAARALGELSAERSVEPLLVLLQDQNSMVRAWAARALGKLGDMRAVEPLLDVLKDQALEVLGSAAVALIQLGRGEGMAPLLALFKDFKDPALLELTAEVSSELGRERALSALFLLAKHEDKDMKNVRAQAAEALAEFVDDERASRVLAGLLRDDESDVRGSAAEALGEFSPGQVTRPLMELLNDDDPRVRQTAAISLGRIKGSEAKKAVFGLFNDKDEKRIVRHGAALALLAFEKTIGLPMLSELARSDFVASRVYAAKILGKLPTEEGAILLLELLDDPHSGVRLQAMESLGKIKAAAAVKPLAEKLTDPNLRVQKAAAKALAEIASEDNVELLRRLAANSYDAAPVRPMLLAALRNVGTKEAAVVIKEVIEKDETVWGLRGYQVLGELRVKESLPFLRQRLKALETQYRERRENPDSQQAPQSWPGEAFSLGYALAQIAPEDIVIKELLFHELAEVRRGSWLGLGRVGTVATLEVLFRERQENPNPLFQVAAYRAMDEILIRLEFQGGDREELRELERFYREAKEREEVGTRVKWTICSLGGLLNECNTAKEVGNPSQRAGSSLEPADGETRPHGQTAGL